MHEQDGRVPQAGDMRLAYRLEAAQTAVAGIYAAVRDIGGTEEQSLGFQEAVRLALLGNLDGARSQLAIAGYDEDAIDALMAAILDGAAGDGRVPATPSPGYPAPPAPQSVAAQRAGIPSRGPLPIARQAMFFGQPAVVVCDARCDKAWGISKRPRVRYSDDPDDYAYLSDGELNWAAVDPGTYEGGHAKPQTPDERLNKWCVRECERCAMSRAGKPNETIEARDFTRRVFNMPWLHRAEASGAAAAEAGETRTSAEMKDG